MKKNIVLSSAGLEAFHPMKKLLKVLLVLLLILVVAIGGLFGFLTVTEYKPADVEAVPVSGGAGAAAVSPEGLTVLSWNIGYAGLGKEQDFFMDGGTKSRPGDPDAVYSYLNGIAAAIDEVGADLVILQEVDTDSSRTYGTDETARLAHGTSAFALNYSCPFVPIPWPPMGKIHSGLFTTTDYAITEASRIALPCPFSWPLSTANLKRCLLVSRLPVEGSDHELVLINLHLEAYDDGEGKIAQTKQLMGVLEEEYKKGNYVIAGGDFNQIFPGGLEAWPNTHPDLWSPGYLEEESLPEGFRYAYDLTVPSCRLLNQPYDPSDNVGTQYYSIDGCILSPNVELVSVETLDRGFRFSDHNPVSLCVTLVP